MTGRAADPLPLRARRGERRGRDGASAPDGVTWISGHRTDAVPSFQLAGRRPVLRRLRHGSAVCLGTDERIVTVGHQYDGVGLCRHARPLECEASADVDDRSRHRGIPAQVHQRRQRRSADRAALEAHGREAQGYGCQRDDALLPGRPRAEAGARVPVRPGQRRQPARAAGPPGVPEGALGPTG